MSDQVKTTDAVKEGSQRANDRLEKPPDAPEIRNASKDQVDNAAAQNPIRIEGMTQLAYKDGYVDDPDKRSIELEALDEKGNKVTIDKNSTKRQKDICLDPHPTSMMPAMTEEIEARIKAKMEGDTPASKNGNGKEAVADTGTLKAIALDADLPQEKRLLAEQFQQMRAAAKVHCHGTDVIDKAAAEVLAPELEAIRAKDPQELYKEYIASNPPDRDDSYAASDSLLAIKSQDKPMPEGRVSEPEMTNAPEGWLTVAQKIAQLPMDKQLQVIGSGLMTGIEQYQHDERERAWGQLIGIIQGTGEVLQGLAKIADFGAACILGNNERAGKMGEEFGTAIGQTIVGGIALFEAADQYLNNICYTGDYAKPFRDVAAAGQALNEQWSQLPPREQERVKAKLITELLADGAIGAGGAGAIQKASKFTEILDAVAVEAKALHAAAKPGIKKAVKTINNVVDELIQPVGDTGMGVRMPIPKDPLKDETKMLMSKADDIGGKSGRPMNRGFDASGKAMHFSDDSGIELSIAKPGQDKLWEQPPVIRGDDVHVGLLENLPHGTKTIDRVVIRDGIAESIKSIDPRMDSYLRPSDLRNKLNDYVRKIQDYEGQPKLRCGFRMKKHQIDEKILHFGVPDNSLTPDQIKVFEDIGRQVLKANAALPPDKAPLKIKVTVLK